MFQLGTYKKNYGQNINTLYNFDPSMKKEGEQRGEEE